MKFYLNVFLVEKRFSLLIIFFLLIPITTYSQLLKLWYDKPAVQWEESLPLGNGRLRAMIYGNEKEEVLQLNESTLWLGGPANFNPNPESPKYLPLIRDAVFR